MPTEKKKANQKGNQHNKYRKQNTKITLFI